LHVSNAVWTVRGRVQCCPPSNDLISWISPAAAVVALNPNWYVNTYTTPVESVRMVQPERPKPLRLLMLFVAGVTCFWFQLSPPSRDVRTSSGWLVPMTPRNPA
jgi:hypothetical protein